MAGSHKTGNPTEATRQPEEIHVLREQLSALQMALRSSEAATLEYRRQVDSTVWSFGVAPSPFIHNLPCVAYVKDLEGRYIYVNQLWETIFEKSFSEWHNKRDEDLWPEPVARKMRSNDETVLTTGRPLSTVEATPTPAGVRHWLVTKFPANPGIAGVAVDITERRRAEQALRESESRYRDLFNSTVIGIYRLRPDGRVSLANPALAQMLGYENPEELTGTELRQLEIPGQQSLLDVLRTEGGVRGYEVRWRRRDGSEIFVRHNSQVACDDSGDPLWFDGVVEDITALKMAARLERDHTHVLEMIVRNQPLDTILREICSLLEHQMPGARCAILLRRRDMLFPAAGPSLPSEFLRFLDRGVPIGPLSGSCGAAVHLGHPIIVSDIQTDAVWTDYRWLTGTFGIRACWSIPFRTCEDSCIGSLAVFHSVPSEPEAAQLELIETSSHLASVAVEHRELYDSLKYQARHDRLTGLPNRTGFEDALDEALRSARWNQARLAILWVDLDRFKQVNDSLGHRIGDALLVGVTQRLKATLGKTALLARLGGDEFALLLPVISGRSDAEYRAQQILDALRTPFQVEEYELFAPASIGVGIFPEDGADSATLMRNVDAAMYQAKTDGRNRFCLHSQTVATSGAERLRLEAGLRRALDNGEFELFYQPQFDASGRLAGFEALLRWNHPQKGLLTPHHFIEIAEDTGLIVPIGRWALRTAARQCADWRAAGLPAVRVAVNVSPLQFYYAEFDQIVRQTLHETGLPPDSIELELTESVVVRDFEECRRQMGSLRAAGITIAIDDFGSGYASLSQLHRLPVSRLKIDRSFLQSDTSTIRQIIRAIAQLGHSLGMTVVMEGVETEEQLRTVIEAGVDLTQGFLVGRPAPVCVAERLLREVPCAPESRSAGCKIRQSVQKAERGEIDPIHGAPEAAGHEQLPGAR